MTAPMPDESSKDENEFNKTSESGVRAHSVPRNGEAVRRLFVARKKRIASRE
jgi:hypothetical protein